MLSSHIQPFCYYFKVNPHIYFEKKLASIINSVEEDPGYLFDHLINIAITNVDIWHALEPRCVAIDPFTEQIYVLITNCRFGYWTTVQIYSQSGEFLKSFVHKLEYTHGMAIH